MGTHIVRVVDGELGEPLTLEFVAEAVGARPAQLRRLSRLGLLETITGEGDQLLIPARYVMRLRRISRLRRDLGVNFAGAEVILDLVDRIEQLNRELAVLRRL